MAKEAAGEVHLVVVLVLKAYLMVVEVEERDYFQRDYLEEEWAGELESSLMVVGVEEGDYFQGDYLEEDKAGELESSLMVV